MINYLWGIMIVIGIIVGALTGRMQEVSVASINSAKEAVTLCITMLGVMSMWMGLMQIAKKSGIIDSLTKLLNPVIKLLFPDIPEGHRAREYICSNMIANILGLGWAATPFGLQAMVELRKLNHESETASVDMCTFLIINVSSLQLIPVNIIAYRSQYGSINPADIIVSAIIATTISTAAGIIFSVVARKLCRKSRRN